METINKKPKFNKIAMRSSFTMLELIFVIVIVGLVAVAGSMAIVQILQNYALQKEYAKLELDSAATIRQLSKYLQDSVWDSISINNGNTYTSIYNINRPEDGSISGNNKLMFIEKNMDAINGRFIAANNANIPYFSGFINLDASGLMPITSTNGSTSGSTSTTTNTSSGNNNITSTIQSGNIITAALSTDADLAQVAASSNISLNFPFVNTGNSSQYDKYFTNTANRTAIFKINAINGQVLTLQNTPSYIGDIGVIVNTNPTTLSKDANNNLIISRTPLNTTNNIVIAQNVSNLYVWTESPAGLIRVRICFNNKIIKSVMNEFCKEGVIMK